MPETHTPAGQEMVTISAREYRELCAAQEKLSKLEEYGVDNWEGYGEAMSEMGDDEDAEGWDA